MRTASLLTLVALNCVMLVLGASFGSRPGVSREGFLAGLFISLLATANGVALIVMLSES